MKQIFIYVGLIVLTAFILAKQTYKDYQESLIEKTNFYYLEQDTYTKDTNTITVFEENKYYTYLGMTTKKNLAEKIKKMYEKENISVQIKNGYTTNQEFLTELSQYDILLESTDNHQEIEKILETILATYQETINQE